MSDPTGTYVTIAKDFHWEMGHRLPFHAGGCQNIHGHSYRMRVVVGGTTDENGMLIDYFDLASIVAPLVDHVDHCFLCDDRDQLMLDFFAANPMKHHVVPFRTTAENLAAWFLDSIAEKLVSFQSITTLTVRVHETERTYAERTRELRDAQEIGEE